jgi:lysozyme family protein
VHADNNFSVPAPEASADQPFAAPGPGDNLVTCRLDQPPTLPERLKVKMFDTAVNTGLKQASKFLQAALNLLGKSLAEDGKIGPKTLRALCGLSETAVLNLYADRQAKFYVDLVARKPSQQKFLNGWLLRANWIPG